MKCLYFLLLVASSQAFVARVARETKDIPTPNLVSLTAVDPPGFVIGWDKVKSLDSSDPILGYKVKVWEQTKVKQYHYETVNGVKVLVEEIVPMKFPNSNQIPEGKPREFLVEGAEKTSVKVEPIEPGMTYEIRVLAYTKSGEGPLSQPMRIQFQPKEDDRQKEMYTVA